jgi:putative ABC transport system permease protein
MIKTSDNVRAAESGWLTAISPTMPASPPITAFPEYGANRLMMRVSDIFQFHWRVFRKHGFRTLMLLLALAIGVIAVNLLTGLGEGARRFVMGEFAVLGTDTLIMLPGKKETTGGMPPLTGEAPRDLTLSDVAILEKLPGVRRVAPLLVGSTEISFQSRNRETVVVGTHQNFFAIRRLDVRQGRPLPDVDLRQEQAVAVIGSVIRQELFGSQPALGEWIRLGDRRFRIIGILSDKGQSMGINTSETVLVPVASAQALFNQEGLFRVFIELKPHVNKETMKTRLAGIMRELHDGQEDVTVISQDSMLAAFNEIIQTMTLAVAGIGGISLVVAGILIMNISFIAVSQRTREIGLLKAIGASRQQIRQLFLSEALLLASLGAFIGMLLSELLLWTARAQWPDIPFQSPMWAKLSAILVTLVTAVLFAWIPANKAASLEAVSALSGQNKAI